MIQLADLRVHGAFQHVEPDKDRDIVVVATAFEDVAKGVGTFPRDPRSAGGDFRLRNAAVNLPAHAVNRFDHVRAHAFLIAAINPQNEVPPIATEFGQGDVRIGHVGVLLLIERIEDLLFNEVIADRGRGGLAGLNKGIAGDGASGEFIPQIDVLLNKGGEEEFEVDQMSFELSVKGAQKHRLLSMGTI